MLVVGSFCLIIYDITNKIDKKQKTEPSNYFAIAISIWLWLIVLNSILLILLTPNLSVINIIFETTSGLTATGASVIPDPEFYPRSIIYLRQQLQLIGAVGIVLITIVVLPNITSANQNNMFDAEFPGVFTQNKITAKISKTAKYILIAYSILTISCIISYYLLGLKWFDAICFGYSTIATGGFTPYSNNFAHINNPFIYIAATIFMLLSSLNYYLHAKFIITKKLTNSSF